MEIRGNSPMSFPIAYLNLLIASGREVSTSGLSKSYGVQLVAFPSAS